MPARKFQCTNLANCDKALSKETIEIAEDEEPVCPECKQKLSAEIKAKTGGGAVLKWVLAGVGALVVVCIIMFAFSSPRKDPAKAEAMLTEFFPGLPPQ